VATTSLKDYAKGDAESMTLSKKKLSLLERKRMYSFNCREAKRLIAAKSLRIATFIAFKARKENLGSDEGGQACTGANS
jgi:hypothetical protein